jgi:hypothetical protein
VSFVRVTKTTPSGWTDELNILFCLLVGLQGYIILLILLTLTVLVCQFSIFLCYLVCVFVFVVYVYLYAACKASLGYTTPLTCAAHLRADTESGDLKSTISSPEQHGTLCVIRLVEGGWQSN